MRMRIDALVGRCRLTLTIVLSLSVATLGAADGPVVVEQAPNLIVNVSAKMAGSVFGSAIDREEPVRDRVLKANVFGTGQTTGQVTAQLVPSSDRATIELIMHTHLTAHTTGYQGPARAHTLQNA